MLQLLLFIVPCSRKHFLVIRAGQRNMYTSKQDMRRKMVSSSRSAQPGNSGNRGFYDDGIKKYLIYRVKRNLFT